MKYEFAENMERNAPTLQTRGPEMREMRRSDFPSKTNMPQMQIRQHETLHVAKVRKSANVQLDTLSTRGIRV